MAARTFLVVLLLGLAAVGCSGDPLAERLESSGRQPYSDDDPPLPTEGPPTTTAPAVTAAPDAPTTTAAPVAATEQAWVEAVLAICAEEIRGLTSPERAQDVDAFVAQMRSLQGAFLTWADRVEALPPPDRSIEVNVAAGVDRLRRSVDILGPAIDHVAAGDVDGALREWTRFGESLAGASTALTAAGVPDACWQ